MSSSLESFGKLLNDTVGGEKLSASKVDRVRDSAVGQFHRGSKVCTIILKVHKKALPRTRLSSLYLFDATCRYAADIVRKKGSGYDHGEVKPPAESMAKQGSKQALTESASTFLQSASDIVEEIVLNTMEAVREDQQLKVIKVVDIWIKAGTFGSDLLQSIKRKTTRISKGDDNEPSSSKIPNTSSNQGTRSSDRDATSAYHQESNSLNSPYGMLMGEESKVLESTRTNTPPQVPSNLLALLGAGSKTGQVSSSADQNGSKQAAPILDASQLAMLQQISQNNSLHNPSTNNKKGTPAIAHLPDHQTAPLRQPPPAVAAAAAVAPPPPQQTSVPPPSHTPDPDPATRTFIAEKKSQQQLLTFVPDPSIGDLSQFNFSLFDPTSALHWVQFAQHWHNTYQYVPSNQECMWAMMSAIQSQAYMANADTSGW